MTANTYARWKALLGRRQTDRAEERAAADRAEERKLEADLLTHVPHVLELHLRPSDWLEMQGRGIVPRLDFRISTVHGILYQDGVSWVRVWGHRVDCASQPDHGPCITLMARVSTILDAMVAT